MGSGRNLHGRVHAVSADAGLPATDAVRAIAALSRTRRPRYHPAVIIGTGIDICEISRMEALLARRGEKAHERLFTAGEVRYCTAKARPGQSFAARFAAKEAVMKLLGTGWSNGVRWRDIEVKRGRGGPPAIELHGEAARLAQRLNIGKIHLSITHSGDIALVHVIGESA